MDAPVKLKETNLTGIFVAVLAIIITLVIFALYRRRKARRNCILLTGLCESGKTLIFAQLIHNKFIQTQTSMKENTGSYIVNNNYLRIVDVPGHERLRNKFIEQYSKLTRGIVFVVDSLNIQQDIQDAAEFLYTILTESVIAQNIQNVLILCNKQDQSLSKGSSVVKSLLEKELTTLCITKASQVDSVDPKSKQTLILGKGHDFSLSSFNFTVDVAESYAFSKDGSVNIDELKKWLLKSI